MWRRKGGSSDGAVAAHRGNAVAWRAARRAAGATATRRDACERRDTQQDSPNAPGWAAREERLAICFGGMCGCEARSSAFTEAYRGRSSGCEGAAVRLIARGGRQNKLRAVPHLAALRGWLTRHRNALEHGGAPLLYVMRCRRRPNDCRIDCNTATHSDGDERHARCADCGLASQRACRRPEPQR